MTEKALNNLIHEHLPEMEVRAEEPMREHCSFRIGGAAEAFAVAENEEELTRLAALCRGNGIPLLVIGRGTNLLISDEGVRGVVVRLGEGLSALCAEGDRITAGAGVTLARLAQFAQQHALTGLEFAHGIPGSLGGAVVMNAGAYGGEMKDVIVSVRCLDDDGVIREYSAGALDFSYRHSRFSEHGGIVLGAVLSLTPGDGEAIAAKMRELMAKRASSQPLDLPSAGSTFKRPASGYAAAMIDGAGLKGFAVGGARVSEKHAGFVVNAGGASFDDVLAVMEHVQSTVREKYGVTLEPEVKIIR